MKPAFAFLAGFALGTLCAAFARTEAAEPQVNLHCITLYGQKADIGLWMAYGGDFERVLGPCGSTMPKAACEAAKEAVNDFRPVIKNEGLVGWRLFAAMCSEAQPVVQM